MGGNGHSHSLNLELCLTEEPWTLYILKGQGKEELSRKPEK